MRTSRRSFLKQTATSALAAPFILPSDVWAAQRSPNSRVTMGFIGMGKQSRGLLGGFLGRKVQVLAVCDVDTTRRKNAQSAQTVGQQRVGASRHERLENPAFPRRPCHSRLAFQLTHSRISGSGGPTWPSAFNL